jgi:cell volume regulation protein A
MLDRRIVGERDPERLGERQFFGEFVIHPGATMGALAAMYGFEVDAEAASKGVDDYLLRRYPRPVVGDRLSLGQVEFVVREIVDGRIAKVGLKLGRS